MDQQQTIEAWAKYVIERWELQIIRLKLIDTGTLLRSFTSHVYTQSNGNVEKIVFAFESYGRFADMGVGFGAYRKQKKWYNKVLAGQIKKLAEIMKEKYAQEAAIAICESVEK